MNPSGVWYRSFWRRGVDGLPIQVEVHAGGFQAAVEICSIRREDERTG
jgi:hypothetical protein